MAGKWLIGAIGSEECFVNGFGGDSRGRVFGEFVGLSQYQTLVASREWIPIIRIGLSDPRQ